MLGFYSFISYRAEGRGVNNGSEVLGLTKRIGC